MCHCVQLFTWILVTQTNKQALHLLRHLFPQALNVLLCLLLCVYMFLSCLCVCVYTLVYQRTILGVTLQVLFTLYLDRICQWPGASQGGLTGYTVNPRAPPGSAAKCLIPWPAFCVCSGDPSQVLTLTWEEHYHPSLLSTSSPI